VSNVFLLLCSVPSPTPLELSISGVSSGLNNSIVLFIPSLSIPPAVLLREAGLIPSVTTLFKVRCEAIIDFLSPV